MDTKYCDHVHHTLTTGYSHDHEHEHHDHDEHGNCVHNDPSSVPLLHRNNSDCNDAMHDHGHDHPQASPDEQILIDFFNAIKYGFKSEVIRLITEIPDIVNRVDNRGYSSVHWAAKRDDSDMLQILYDSGASLGVPTADDTKMYPIHWAASEGKVACIAYLLSKRQDINIQAANGSTPVVVATQHNLPTCVCYLIKQGADLTLTDVNGDTALHWAAYKGFVELLGLLVYFMPHEVDAADNYGQSPLHLAALRGNLEAVQYLVLDLNADTIKRDRNGLTPLELSIKKEQLQVEWFLRLHHVKYNIIELVKSLDSNKLKNATVIKFLLLGYEEKEYAYWPWRIVFVSNLLASLVTIQSAMDYVLADLYFFHLIGVMFQVVWWLLFYMCLVKSPGIVQDNPNPKYSYATAIETIGNTHVSNASTPHVCHTCHVLRPLRSKHCKIKRCCVQKFDHFCPFVGNTVGRDNYKYFVSLLFTHAVCFFFWIIVATYTLRRVTISWMYTLYILYSCLWQVLIFSLLGYHLQLIFKNLTTNEHVNTSKYKYLKNSSNFFENPYDKHSQYDNFMDGMFPSTQDFYSREEVLQGRMN